MFEDQKKRIIALKPCQWAVAYLSVPALSSSPSLFLFSQSLHPFLLRRLSFFNLLKATICIIFLISIHLHIYYIFTLVPKMMKTALLMLLVPSQ